MIPYKRDFSLLAADFHFLVLLFGSFSKNTFVLASAAAFVAAKGQRHTDTEHTLYLIAFLTFPPLNLNILSLVTHAARPFVFELNNQSR